MAEETMLEEPVEKLREDESSDAVDVRGTVKRAALTAVIAAAIGAAAGAAKTALDRRAEEKDDEPEARAEPAEDDSDDEEPEAHAEPAEEEEQERQDEPEAHAEPDEDEDEAEPEASAEHDDDEEDEPQQGRAEHDDEPDDEDEEDDSRARLEDAENADSDAGEIVPRAREQLERLLGREAESVSGFERQDGHWKVSLEVVELRRIPDSSDVLASYELTIDDEGQVARMTRTRRYQRADVETG